MSSIKFKQLETPDELEKANITRYMQWLSYLALDDVKDRGSLTEKYYEKPWDLSHWGVVKTNGNEKEDIVLSSLGFYSRPSIVKIKGKKPQEATSHSVIMVVTHHEHRKKGYASQLLEGVVKEIDKAQSKVTPPNQVNFSTLWSDVGEYYSAFGYKSIAPVELVINIDSDKRLLNNDSYANIHWITEKDFNKLAQEEKKNMLEEIDAATEKDGITRVALTPTADCYRYFFVNGSHDAFTKYPEMFSHTGVKKGKDMDLGMLTSVFRPGARYGSVSMLWDIKFKSSSITILRTTIDNDERNASTPEDLVSKRKEILENIVVLLEVAVEEAKKWKLTSITFWRGDVPVSKGLNIGLEDIKTAWNQKHQKGFEASIQTRTLTIPMIRFAGNEKLPVEWFSPGYYPWS